MSTPAYLTLQRLGDVARPAGGRAPRRTVMLAVVPAAALDRAARELERLVMAAAGPTRLGPTVVDVACTEDAVARALSSPITLHVPVVELMAVSQVYDAFPKPAVVLVGHCTVLWPQTSDRVRRS